MACDIRIAARRRPLRDHAGQDRHLLSAGGRAPARRPGRPGPGGAAAVHRRASIGAEEASGSAWSSWYGDEAPIVEAILANDARQPRRAEAGDRARGAGVRSDPEQDRALRRADRRRRDGAAARSAAAEMIGGGMNAAARLLVAAASLAACGGQRRRRAAPASRTTGSNAGPRARPRSSAPARSRAPTAPTGRVLTIRKADGGFRRLLVDHRRPRRRRRRRRRARRCHARSATAGSRSRSAATASACPRRSRAMTGRVILTAGRDARGRGSGDRRGHAGRGR